MARARQPQRHNKLDDRVFLEEVARVYRENIAGSPTAAVAVRYGKKQRQAAAYVQAARAAGLLPPTRQGKKEA